MRAAFAPVLRTTSGPTIRPASPAFAGKSTPSHPQDPVPNQPHSGPARPKPTPKPKRWKQALQLFSLLLAAVVTSKAAPIIRDHTQSIQAPATPGSSSTDTPFLNPDHVYVLHSGLGDGWNWGAREIKRHLLTQGISEERIIILDSPFPQLGGLGSRSARELFTRFLHSYTHQDDPAEKAYWTSLTENLAIYRQSAQPQSAVVKQQASQLRQTLSQRGLTGVPVTWIGYSAGGQMGLSMAALNGSEGAPRIERVVTLGSPILQNSAPPAVEVISVVSSDDSFFKTVLTWDELVGLSLHAFAPNLDRNDRAILIQGPDHAGMVIKSDALHAVMRALSKPASPG